MTDETPPSSSGNAVNEPWPYDEVRRVNYIRKGRSSGRAYIFEQELRDRLPNEVQTEIMIEIARAMAEMSNGPDSILIYTGHPEKASPTRNQEYTSTAIAVIERLGYAAVEETQIPPNQIVWAVSELYRHSPECEPAHHNWPSDVLEDYIRSKLARYTALPAASIER